MSGLPNLRGLSFDDVAASGEAPSGAEQTPWSGQS